jgi:hypothetical protein
MLSSESDSESSSAAAEVSETHNLTSHKCGKRELQFPVPGGLSDSEDDAKSTHVLALLKKARNLRRGKVENGLAFVLEQPQL